VPNPKPPENGPDGKPLGPDGNGANGEASWWGKCVRPAGPGKPGNQGWPPPGADNGANGKDAYSVIIQCNEYSGAALRLLNHGGDGAPGNDGGRGGDGSAGGNAGKQPKGCKDTINGGVGGNAGNGGNAGSGGDAGNSANISVLYGPGFNNLPVSAKSSGGKAAVAGNYGAPGTPGKGGIDSNGEPAKCGATGKCGSQGTGGKGGGSGTFSIKQDPTMGRFWLKITFQSNTTV
jgi:hypothetical protein